MMPRSNRRDAEKALSCGLVSEIVEIDGLMDRAMALADEMLATAPMGLRLTKDALNRNIDANGLADAMAIEDRQQVMMAVTEDHREAITAFLEKRPPQFKDR